VHQVADQPRLYYDAWSTNHQEKNGSCPHTLHSIIYDPLKNFSNSSHWQGAIYCKDTQAVRLANLSVYEIYVTVDKHKQLTSFSCFNAEHVTDKGFSSFTTVTSSTFISINSLPPWKKETSLHEDGKTLCKSTKLCKTYVPLVIMTMSFKTFHSTVHHHQIFWLSFRIQSSSSACLLCVVLVWWWQFCLFPVWGAGCLTHRLPSHLLFPVDRHYG
jgi:hypothetical protein